ncbi:MAG: bacteriohemerythrin [Treponema sp.]|nr:bacteriohemerythrin [Treponema sp.]
MAFMIWSPAYEFGISEIDQQHRYWIELVNNIYYDFLKQNDKDRVHAMFTAAIDFMHYHFSEEERMMHIIGYPALDNQQKQHAEIGARIEHFRKDIREDNIIITRSVVNKLRKIFVQHILIEDKKYVELYNRVKANK